MKYKENMIVLNLSKYLSISYIFNLIFHLNKCSSLFAIPMRIFQAIYYFFENKYSISAMNSSEVHRVEQLVESTILFDKSGELSKIQKTRKKY